MKKFLTTALVAAAFSATAAYAADLKMATKAPPPPPAASPWDVAFGSWVASDYNFRGVTQSAHKPAVGVYFEPRYNINKDLQLYIGMGGESIDFPNHPNENSDALKFRATLTCGFNPYRNLDSQGESRGKCCILRQIQGLTLERIRALQNRHTWRAARGSRVLRRRPFSPNVRRKFFSRRNPPHGNAAENERARLKILGPADRAQSHIQLIVAA